MINTDNLINRVSQGLDEIRPYLQSDGGNISLVKITPELKVFIKFEGACKT